MARSKKPDKSNVIPFAEARRKVLDARNEQQMEETGTFTFHIDCDKFIEDYPIDEDMGELLYEDTYEFDMDDEGLFFPLSDLIDEEVYEALLEHDIIGPDDYGTPANDCQFRRGEFTYRIYDSEGANNDETD